MSYQTLRGNRSARQALRGPERTERELRDMSRDRQRSPVEKRQYYEDAGQTLTDAQREQWQARQTQQRNWEYGDPSKKNDKGQVGVVANNKNSSDYWNKVYNEQQSLIDNYKVDDYDDLFNSAWKDYKKGFKTVRVVKNGSDIEDSYKLPKDVINKITNYIDDKYGSPWTSWHGNNMNIDIKLRNGKTRGQEIHDLFREAANSMKGSYESAIRGTLNKTISEQNKARNSMIIYRDETLSPNKSAAQGAYDASKAILKQGRDLYNNLLTEEKQAYNDKLNSIAEVFGGLNVGKK